MYKQLQYLEKKMKSCKFYYQGLCQASALLIGTFIFGNWKTFREKAVTICVYFICIYMSI